MNSKSALTTMLFIVPVIAVVLVFQSTRVPAAAATKTAAKQVTLAKPTHYVEDRAGVIPEDTERQLNGLLQELEQKTGAQYIVLTINTLGGIPIETFSIELMQQWKLGDKDRDDGMFFLMATDDRKYRFEAGYGLEGVITDTFSGQTGREYIIPYARKGDYGTGIYLANAAIAKRIAESKGVVLSGMPKLNNTSGTNTGGNRRSGGSLLGIIPTIIIIILVLLMGGRRGLFWYLLLGGLGGGNRSHGSSRSSGFGGGGFGSFGGGGGGGFGGGGSSGSW